MATITLPPLNKINSDQKSTHPKNKKKYNYRDIVKDTYKQAKTTPIKSPNNLSIDHDLYRQKKEWKIL